VGELGNDEGTSLLGSSETLAVNEVNTLRA